MLDDYIIAIIVCWFNFSFEKCFRSFIMIKPLNRSSTSNYNLFFNQGIVSSNFTDASSNTLLKSSTLNFTFFEILHFAYLPMIARHCWKWWQHFSATFLWKFLVVLARQVFSYVDYHMIVRSHCDDEDNHSGISEIGPILSNY